MYLKCLSLRRKKGNKIPLFLNKLTKKLLFCILFLKIKNNRNKKAKPFSSYRLFFYSFCLEDRKRIGEQFLVKKKKGRGEIW